MTVTLTTSEASALRKALAKHIRPPRRAVRDFYDAWVAEGRATDDARPTSFLHAITRATQVHTGLNPADDTDALVLALSALGSVEDISDWFGAAASHRLFDPVDAGPQAQESARADLLKAVETALHRSIKDTILQLHRDGLQNLQSVLQTFSDPGHLLPAIKLARRRLCRITSNRLDDGGVSVSKGTGFLIGPSIVLTNFHVVEHLFPEDGALPRRGAQENLTCHFDYSSTTGRMHHDEAKFGVTENWCLGFSPYGKITPDDAPEFWWKDTTRRTNWLQQVQGNYDYALIQLDGAPGLRRGWYDLRNLGSMADSRGCWTFHHPGGDHLALTGGNVHQLDLSVARIFHDASTINGSSGGLVVNRVGKPIALHHAGYGLDVMQDGQPANIRAWEDFINMAVPLGLITEDLRAKDLLSKLDQPSEITLFRNQIERGHPVFGRTKFFDQLKDFYNGPEDSADKKRNIMMIHTDPVIDDDARPGKSFSVRIIRDVFAGGGHAHVELGPNERRLDARGLARALMQQLEPDRTDDLEETLNTTGPAFALALAREIKRTLRKPRYANRMVWIYLDDLEHADVPDGSGREFLSSLYASASELSNLRIVLIGLPARTQIGGFGNEQVVESPIPFDDLDNLGETFKDWALSKSNGRLSHDDKGLDLLAGGLASFAEGGPPFERAAAFAENHLAPLIARLAREQE